MSYRFQFLHSFKTDVPETSLAYLKFLNLLQSSSSKYTNTYILYIYVYFNIIYKYIHISYMKTVIATLYIVQKKYKMIKTTQSGAFIDH